MKNDAVTKKIRLLKHISPNPDWLKSQRNFLLSEISHSETGKKTRLPSRQAKLVWNLPGFLIPKFAFKPAIISLLLLGLIFGGGFLTVKAAQNSLPGDLLYSLKIVFEKARVQVSSQTTKPKLEADFVNNRAEELSQIVEETENPLERKDKVVKITDKLQAQVVKAKTHMDKIKAEEPEKAVEVAETVDEKTAQSEKVLTQAKEKLIIELEQEESEETVDTIKAIDKALAILLNKEGEETETTIQMEVEETKPSEEEEPIITSPTTPLKTINEASESFEEEITK